MIALKKRTKRFLTSKSNSEMNISIVVAQKEHYTFAAEICDTIETSALQRGTGIAKRTPEYIQKKMETENAVIAIIDGKFAGFCYIESWQHGQFVAHSAGTTITSRSRRTTRAAIPGGGPAAKRTMAMSRS